jgi:GxxExxY protein
MITAETAENAEIGHSLCNIIAVENAETHDQHDTLVDSAISAHSAARSGSTAETTEKAEMQVNHVTEQIIGAAIEVHRALGPGLLESAYEACLARELAERSLHIEAQKALPVTYKDVRIDCGYRIDLLVEHEIVAELKSIARLEPIHEAQLLSYLRLSGCRVGLLINFNVRHLMTGVRRLVNAFPE